MWEWIQKMAQPEFWVAWVENLGEFRFLAGFFLAMIEAFFPPLPLAAIVSINIIGFGFVVGYGLSYSGTVLGTIMVYLTVKAMGSRHLIPWLYRQKEYMRFRSWIQEKGAMALTVLFFFPFTPSILVSALAALSEMRKREFILATLLGKLIMILILSVIGYQLSDFWNHPIRSGIVLAMMFIFLFLAKNLFQSKKRKANFSLKYQKRKRY